MNNWTSSRECLLCGDSLGFGRHAVDVRWVEVEGRATPLAAGTCKHGQGLSRVCEKRRKNINSEACGSAVEL